MARAPVPAGSSFRCAKDGAVLGVVTAFRQEVKPFSENQISLLENFAA
jgi:hypothetical protein